jgi:hypothetical protein
LRDLIAEEEAKHFGLSRGGGTHDSPGQQRCSRLRGSSAAFVLILEARAIRGTVSVVRFDAPIDLI